MNFDDDKSTVGGSATSLRLATLAIGLVLAMIMSIAMMSSSSKAQLSAEKMDPDAPPGYDPNAPESIEVPLQFEPVEGEAEGEFSPQAISNTNCTARLDKPHASKHTGWTRIGAYIGVRNCTYKKKRIYAKIAIQIWDPSVPVWRNIKVRETNSYDTRTNVKYAVKECSKTRYHYYRSALLNAVIYDYDGDRHRMIFRRYGDANRAICYT